jgi:GNAT superfamily N-acetyltransferase
MPPIRIEKAGRSDVPLILGFIRQLAEYEHLTHMVVATEEMLEAALFGEHPAAEVVIGYYDEVPAGFALFFTSFSTFLGRPGLYLEDLFVQPEYRGKGVGKALLRHLAQIARERNYGRLEWSVLNWNEPAIRFYESLGAEPLDEWTVYRVTGPALEALAQGADEAAPA